MLYVQLLLIFFSCQWSSKQHDAVFSFRYEFGQALFTGWAAASLCLLGGALLSCSCPRKTTSYPTPRPYPKPTPSSGKDYV